MSGGLRSPEARPVAVTSHELACLPLRGCCQRHSGRRPRAPCTAGQGPDALLETMLVGIAGSFIAGVIAHLLFGAAGGGIVLSVPAATAIVYWMRGRRGGEPVRPFGSHG